MVMQAVGFLAQTLPVAVLCCVPFSDGELRLPRGRLLGFLCGGLCLAAAGLGILAGGLSQGLEGRDTLLNTVGDAYMSVCLLAFAVTFFWTVHTDFRKKFLVFVLLVHYAAILFTVAVIITTKMNRLLGSGGYYMPYAVWDVASYVVLGAVTVPFLYAFLKRTVRRSLPAMENIHLRRGSFYFTIALLLYCVCASVVRGIFQSGSSGREALIFLVGLVCTDVMLYYMFFTEVRTAAENLALARQFKGFQEQYRQIRLNAEGFRRFRHDMRHHLNVIAALNQEGRSSELEQYLKRYTQVYQELERRPLSGYVPLDAVLRYYIDRAVSMHIRVETDLCPMPDEPGLDVVDVTVLMGNLLENAINACQVSGEKEPWIRLTMRIRNRALLILAENTCQKGGVERTEYGDETLFLRTGSPGHGQGLRSIRVAAEKYGGSAEFKKTGGLFSARIVLNLP